MNRLIIVGASGHGKVVADIAIKCGYSDIVFLDDDKDKHECAGFPIVGSTNEIHNVCGDIVVAIGNAQVRKSIMEHINTVSLIHPSANISRRVKIGEGTVVMAGAVINSDSEIGKGCIINTGSSVDHDCRVGDYSHIAVGAHVAGNCNIGSMTWVGAGAVVSNNIDVCGECIIGAGAVVVKNINEHGVYVGVPSERLKK